MQPRARTIDAGWEYSSCDCQKEKRSNMLCLAVGIETSVTLVYCTATVLYHYFSLLLVPAHTHTIEKDDIIKSVFP